MPGGVDDPGARYLVHLPIGHRKPGRPGFRLRLRLRRILSHSDMSGRVKSDVSRITRHIIDANFVQLAIQPTVIRAKPVLKAQVDHGGHIRQCGRNRFVSIEEDGIEYSVNV